MVLDRQYQFFKTGAEFVAISLMFVVSLSKIFTRTVEEGTTEVDEYQYLELLMASISHFFHLGQISQPSD